MVSVINARVNVHMTKEIYIKWKDNNYTVLVDDDCYALLSRHTWYIMYSGVNKRPYAFAELYSKPKSKKRIKRMFYMHQMVTGSFAQTDHENGNSLDNRFDNLRPATHQTNGWNKGKSRKPSTSKYKGVSYRPLRGKPRWLAFFKYVEEGKPKHTGKMLYIGYYDTEREAAIAYDKKVLELRGKWAYTNILKNNKSQGR